MNGASRIATRASRTDALRLRAEWPLWCAALAVAVLFVGHHPGRLSAPFGPSHDGFNAALFMNGARALVEDGAVSSRFGAVMQTLSGDRIIYAHHPPLVYLADAAAALALGPTETAARLPAVVSSLVALLLLVLLLRACGFHSGPAAVALLFACATPMFMMFGTTIEPHVLGLAPMTALALLWQRLRSGASTASTARWPLAIVGAVAAVTSWQAGLMATLVALILLFVDRQRTAGSALLAGTLTVAILTACWIAWAYDGEPGNIVTRAIHRLGISGHGAVALRDTVRQQMRYFADLFPVGGWLAVPVAAYGLFDGRTRPLVAASLGAVLGYALLFRNGAYDHAYWLYCILLPLTLGAAAVAQRVTRACAERTSLQTVPILTGTALVAALGVTVWQPSGEETHRRWAAESGAQARIVEWPAGQRYAYHMFGDRGPTDLLPWLLFYARREPYGVDGPKSVPVGEVMLRSLDGRLVTVPGEQALVP